MSKSEDPDVQLDNPTLKELLRAYLLEKRLEALQKLSDLDQELGLQ